MAFCSSKVSCPGSVAEVKALTIFRGARLAIEMGLLTIILEKGALSMVNMVLSKEETYFELRNVIVEIVDYQQLHGIIYLSFVCPEANVLAYDMGKYASSVVDELVRIMFLPSRASC
ncbi:hypothetical protein ACOSQ4_014190 [Xanthoceras sorbifolium]